MVRWLHLPSQQKYLYVVGEGALRVGSDGEAAVDGTDVNGAQDEKEKGDEWKEKMHLFANT